MSTLRKEYQESGSTLSYTNWLESEIYELKNEKMMKELKRLEEVKKQIEEVKKQTMSLKIIKKNYEHRRVYKSGEIDVLNND